MTLKQKALAHYDRMIAWAEKQPKRGHISTFKMELEIGEAWRADDCLYCKKHTGYCFLCKLYSLPKYDGQHCCDGLWHDMNKSAMWGTWVKRARRVREYIEQHG